MTDQLAVFAATFAALYAAHHVGDYWIQTDHQAKHKGLPTNEGREACALHVLSYLTTQLAFLVTTGLVVGWKAGFWQLLAALAVSGGTHYFADRREPLRKLAALIPGKAAFWELGKPRTDIHVTGFSARAEGRVLEPIDNPTLGTGAWALDQSWHIAFSVFIPALILAL